METTATSTQTYTGQDYLAQLNAKPETEQLKANFTSSGLQSTNAEELAASRKTNKLFSEKNQLGKDEFLLLLTTQLKYQDPMNPISNEDSIAQMAQFSALENMQNVEKAVTGMDDSYHQSLTIQQESAAALQTGVQSISDALTAQNSGQLAMNNALTSSLIGKSVRMEVNSVAMQQDQYGDMPSKTLYFHTDSPADAVKINIKDANGNVVRTLNASTLDSAAQYDCPRFGDHQIEFDGRDNEGNAIAPGVYTVQFTASLAGKAIDGQVFEQGMVGGIDYTKNGVQVQVNSVNEDGDTYTTTMPLGKIIAVRETVTN